MLGSGNIVITGGGETNTASNVGGGIANFAGKVGADLQFNSFFANDFNLSGNLLSIDYANGQTASTTQKGFLLSTDWTTFNAKQAALVSGTNIKTINGNSILGSGDLVISGGSSYVLPIATATVLGGIK